VQVRELLARGRSAGALRVEAGAAQYAVTGGELGEAIVADQDADVGAQAPGYPSGRTDDAPGE